MNVVDGADCHLPFKKDQVPERLVGVRESGDPEELGQDGRFHGEQLPKLLWDDRKTFYLQGRRNVMVVIPN